MSTWRIFKKILTKKVDAVTAKDRETIDKNLPLGFRLGGLVTLDQSDFIIHRDKLQFKSPGQEHVVKAWGEYEIHGNKFYRFYLLGKENEAESVIEVAMVDGIVSELKMLQNFDEIVPETADDWDVWLNKDDGLIGDEIFEVVENEDTEEEEVITYHNQWGDGRIAPVSFTETLYLDKYGDNTEQVETTGILFGRPINEDELAVEYLMVGQEENDENAWIRMLIGINIGESDIKVV